jgi:hypothetical protein
MGPGELIPPLPHLGFLQVPDAHKYVSKFLVEGTYLQALEGDVDSSHVSFLHSKLDQEVGYLLAGQEPPEAGEAEQDNIRALDVILPRTAVWEEEAQEAMSADKPWLAVAM